MSQKDVRMDVVHAAVWAVESKKHGFEWSYMQYRPVKLDAKFPKKLDCSMFYTWCYRVGGAKDPNRRGYSGIGWTGTLMDLGKKIEFKDLRVGDAVIYGAYPGSHGAIVVKLADKPGDVLTVSMGQNGDPSYVKISQDGRPYAFYTYDTTLNFTPLELPKFKKA